MIHRRRNRLRHAPIWCAVVCLLASSTTGYSPVSAAERQPTFDYHQTTLSNGLDLITLEDFSCPIVAVQLWYHVGSKNESPERQGFAHMFEHMMFRGTDRLGPTDHFDLVHQVGGDCNAYTTFDQTVYHETLPANQLELALWLEADRMSMLKIDQKSFDTERKVVEEERRMGLNRPYGSLFEKVLPLVAAGHPYRWSTIGSIPDLRAASVPELRAFWTKYYVPNNATLVIVGAVKHDRAVQLVKKYFGWIPQCPDPPRVAMPPAGPLKKQDVTLKLQNAPAPLVAILFRGVPMASDDAVALDLMTTILGGGPSSRLYRRIVAEDRSAVMAMAGAMSLEQNGVVGAGALLAPVGSDPDKVLETIKSEIKRLCDEPVSEQELLKARNQMLEQLVEQDLTVTGKARALGTAAVLEGDVSRVNSRIGQVRAVDAATIQRVARKYLDLNHAVTLRVQRNLLGSLGNMLGMKDNAEDAPVTGAPETNPPAPGRPGVSRPEGYPSAPPLAKRLSYRTQVDIKSAKLPNGLRLIVAENHEVPFISAMLGLSAGAWTETKPGTASLALQMLVKGTAKHSEEELADLLDTYAISLSGDATMDSSTIDVGCLPEQVGRAVKILAEVVQTPTMPESEFTSLIAQVRTGMSVQEREPTYLAGRELRRQIFAGHPYARSAAGELGDLKQLRRDDLMAWWKQYARPDQATLIFAGDIGMERAKHLAEEYFGEWHNHGKLAMPQLAPIPKTPKTRIFLVDFPGAQSQIRVGRIGLTRKDPGYFVSRVVSGYFGGAFNSRLNETIRVKKGLTYGAHGEFSAQRFAGRFSVSTFSKTATTVDAVRAIFDEFARLRNEPPSAKELGSTISYILGAFPATHETPQQVAGQEWLRRSCGLPDDYFDRLLDGVAHTSANDCVQLARSRVDPDTMVVVVVGSASKLKSALEKIAPVTVLKP